MIGMLTEVRLGRIEARLVDPLDSNTDALLDEIEHTERHPGATACLRKRDGFADDVIGDDELPSLAGEVGRHVARGRVTCVLLVDECVET
jgi:hypothetical protein